MSTVTLTFLKIRQTVMEKRSTLHRHTEAKRMSYDCLTKHTVTNTSNACILVMWTHSQSLYSLRPDPSFFGELHHRAQSVARSTFSRHCRVIGRISVWLQAWLNKELIFQGLYYPWVSPDVFFVQRCALWFHIQSFRTALKTHLFQKYF